MSVSEKFVYKFFISIDENGKQNPIMTFGVNPNYKNLGNLAIGDLSKVYGVKRDLKEIEKVNSGEKDKHTVAGDDWCIVIYEKEISTIVNGFDESEPFEMESPMFHKFLTDW